VPPPRMRTGFLSLAASLILTDNWSVRYCMDDGAVALKSRQFREFFFSLMHMHRAVLRAAAESGYGFPWI
jgi:hypothetical protein